LKITIIRHEKVDFRWRRLYRLDGIVRAFRDYDECAVIGRDVFRIDTDAPVYISDMRRTLDSAVKIFGNREFIRSPLFNEVPIQPFTSANFPIPTVIWAFLGRLLWFFKNTRQIEPRTQTRERAERAIDLLESDGRDCYVVSHAFFMHTLFRALRFRGYEGKFGLIRIRNLQRFDFEKDLSEEHRLDPPGHK